MPDLGPETGVQFTYDRQDLLNNLAPRAKLGDYIVELENRVTNLEARVAELEEGQS